MRLALRDDPPPLLGHGFRTTARIAVWHKDDVLTVPVQALFRSGADWAVYVVADGRAALRKLALGQRNDMAAQVLDGLAEGETVILHPGDTIAPDVRIAQ